jgi:hypothetical protein
LATRSVASTTMGAVIALSARSNLLFEKNETLACIALAGQSSSPRRLPSSATAMQISSAAAHLSMASVARRSPNPPQNAIAGSDHNARIARDFRKPFEDARTSGCYTATSK